jgi:hypothetical protein
MSPLLPFLILQKSLIKSVCGSKFAGIAHIDLFLEVLEEELEEEALRAAGSPIVCVVGSLVNPLSIRRAQNAARDSDLGF